VDERLMLRADVRESGRGRKKNQLKTHFAQVMINVAAAGNGGVKDDDTVPHGVIGVPHR